MFWKNPRKYLIICHWFITVCLLFAVVFNWTAEVAPNVKLKLYPNLTFYFPWSLLLAGFGACGNLILDIVHFILLFRSLAPSEAARRETFHPNSYVQLRQISHDTTLLNGSCSGHDSQCKNQITEEKEPCHDSVEEEGEEEGDKDSVAEGRSWAWFRKTIHLKVHSFGGILCEPSRYMYEMLALACACGCDNQDLSLSIFITT